MPLQPMLGRVNCQALARGGNKTFTGCKHTFGIVLAVKHLDRPQRKWVLNVAAVML